MSSFVVEHHVDAETAATLLAPRTDLLVETGDLENGFEQAEGPFERYRRTLIVHGQSSTLDTPGDASAKPATSLAGRQHITETVDFRLAIPLWRPIVNVLMKRALKETDRAPRDRWWWPSTVVTTDTSKLISAVAILSLMAGYLGVLIGQTITFAATEFDASQADQSNTLAAMRVGVLVSLILIGRADRIGRKPLMIGFTTGSVLFTALGAFAPSLVWLGAAQAIARGLDTGLFTLLALVVAEEVPAKVRATILGLMTMCTGLGSGLVVLSLPLVDLGVRAWRLTYLLPLLFLPLVWWCWSFMPETTRFSAATQVGAPDKINRARFALIAITAFASTLYLSPASQLQNTFLQDEQGFSATQISLFRLIVGTPVGIPILLAGFFSDRRGRKPIGAVGVAIGSLASLAAFFSTGVMLWVFSAASVWLLAAAFTVLRSYSTELFPTRSRARIGGWIDLISVCGSVIGLVVVGRLTNVFDTFGPAMSVMIFGPLLTATIVLFFYPETASKELEEFNPSDPTIATADADGTSPAKFSDRR